MVGISYPLLNRLTVSNGLSLACLVGLLKSGWFASWSIFHNSSEVKLCIEDRFEDNPVPEALLRLRKAGWGNPNSARSVDELLGDSWINIWSGICCLVVERVMSRPGWRLDAEGGPEDWVLPFTDERRFQAGGGASGSPESCRCNVLIGDDCLLLWVLCESEEGDLLWLPPPDFEEEDRERARDNS